MDESQKSEQPVSPEERISQLEEEVARLKQINTRLESLAGKDALTELDNRRTRDRDLRQVIGETIRGGEEFAFLSMDLDKFKEINDTYGHEAGDEVLKTVAVVLKTELHRPGDLPYRRSGDEYEVLLKKTSKAAGVYVATKLQDAINRLQFTFNGAQVQILASFGVTSFKPEKTGQSAKGITMRTDPDNIAREADQALYAAKKDENKNKVGFFCGSEEEKFEVGEFLRSRQIDMARVIPFTPPISRRT